MVLSSIPYLLHPNKEDNISTKTLLQNDVKSVGFYLSGDWYASSRTFTPELAKLYKEAQSNCQPFHIIFISCDRDEESFNEYRSEMPWPAVPFNSDAVVKEYFQVSSKTYFY